MFEWLRLWAWPRQGQHVLMCLCIFSGVRAFMYLCNGICVRGVCIWSVHEFDVCDQKINTRWCVWICTRHAQGTSRKICWTIVNNNMLRSQLSVCVCYCIYYTHTWVWVGWAKLNSCPFVELLLRSQLSSVLSSSWSILIPHPCHHHTHSSSSSSPFSSFPSYHQDHHHCHCFW